MNTTSFIWVTYRYSMFAWESVSARGTGWSSMPWKEALSCVRYRQVGSGGTRKSWRPWWTGRTLVERVFICSTV